MALIDRLIGALFKQNGEQLSLTPGRPVVITSGGRDRPISRKSATEEQIEDVLSHVAPGDIAILTAQGTHEIGYDSPSGAVTLTVIRAGGSVQLIVAPGKSNTAAPAAESIAPPPGFQQGHGGGGGPSTSRAAGARAAAPRPAKIEIGSRPPLRPDAPRMEKLFKVMVDEGCSDLHFCSDNPPLFRKDGEIVPIDDTVPKSPEEVASWMEEIAPKKNWKQFQETGDCDFAYEMEGWGRFRSNFFQDLRGPGAVFRLIPSEILTAEDLKLPKSILDLCYLSKGLVVVTGPTGSGKSTTLAALIDYINRNRSEHIITIEDPVEFVHPNKKCLINQREVGLHTQSFKAALKAALREDPDIVLVGEMRDLETIAIAIETAETGHLVFGTLHTSTAPSTVDRIIDQFPAGQQAQIRTMLSESLKGVVAQVLCRKKGGGRCAAMEILLVNAACSNLIREGKTFQIPSIMQTGRAQGMVTMTDSLVDLVKADKVEPLEAYQKAIKKDEMKMALKRHNIDLDV